MFTVFNLSGGVPNEEVLIFNGKLDNVKFPTKPKQPPSVSAVTKDGGLARDGRFIAYANGTVLDTQTDLMWAARDDGKGLTEEDAKVYCENYNGGGHTDWRMPTIGELAGLSGTGRDERKSRCCPLCPGFNVSTCFELSCCSMWSSEAYKSKVFDFDFCFASKGIGEKSDKEDLRVIPVRFHKVD